jgi:putative membrane protein
MPSIGVVWLLGLALAFAVDAWGQGWFYAKLALVLGLSAYHGYLSGYAGKLAKGERPLSGKQLRLLNEVPGVAVALIVILVVVKPF